MANPEPEAGKLWFARGFFWGAIGGVLVILIPTILLIALHKDAAVNFCTTILEVHNGV